MRRGVLAVALVLVACSGGGGSEDTAGPTTLTEVAASSLLQDFSLDDPADYFALMDAPTDASLVREAGIALEGGASGDELWAATYVWVNGGDDPAPLRPLVADPDPAVRVMAATGLLRLGDAAGFDPLVAALADETPLRGHVPQVPAWVVATGSLARYTGIADHGPPLDADATKRTEGQARWQAWLDANRATLTFDEETQLWSAG